MPQAQGRERERERTTKKTTRVSNDPNGLSSPQDQGKKKLAEELLEELCIFFHSCEWLFTVFPCFSSMLAVLQDIFRANTELTESSPNITVGLSKQVAGRAVCISLCSCSYEAKAMSN